jgi:hypothetical protein
MTGKRSLIVYFLSFLLIVCFSEGTLAKSSKRTSSKSHSSSSKKGEKASESTAEKSPLALGLDSVFIKMKADLDEVAGSSLLHAKAAAPVDNLFLKSLKAHQPFYSLTRVNKKGEVVNEMIRLVEKPDEKKQNLSKETWFKNAVKKQADYSSVLKLEETGRYYLVWAVPIVADKETSKGKEVFEGGLALKIDLWDSFHKFAKNVETPFLVRLGKMPLYSNKWKDTIEFKEETIDVQGVKKCSIRYPKSVTTFVTTPEPPVAAIPAIDSAKIRAATQDSLNKAIAAAKDKKKKANAKMVVIAVLIVLIIIVGILIFVIVPGIRQRALMKNIDSDIT